MFGLRAVAVLALVVSAFSEMTTTYVEVVSVTKIETHRITHTIAVPMTNSSHFSSLLPLYDGMFQHWRGGNWPSEEGFCRTEVTTAPRLPQSMSESHTFNTMPTHLPYEEAAITHHNLHRRNHSAPDIAWDGELARIAKVVAASCAYAHNVDAGGGGYGQNIAAGVRPDNISAVITNLFYNDEVAWFRGLYHERRPSMRNFEHWGHFTQVVWQNTRRVGCFTSDCTGSGLANGGDDVAPFFTVCNYQPPGNVAGAYDENVLPPLGYPTAEWNTA